MTESMPEWAKQLFDELIFAVEFQAFATLEGRHFAPDETSWGVDLIEVAPALLEMVEAGPHDGDAIYGLIDTLDLKSVQESLECVSAFSLGFNESRSPQVTVEGLYKGHEVVVVIYALPFADAQVSGEIDTTRGELQFRLGEDDDDDEVDVDRGNKVSPRMCLSRS